MALLQGEPFFLAERVAELTNVKEATLAGWRTAGVGPPWVRIGKLIMYHAGDLRAWLRARRLGTSRAAGRLRGSARERSLSRRAQTNICRELEQALVARGNARSAAKKRRRARSNSRRAR
jgi:hypothetical protein